LKKLNDSTEALKNPSATQDEILLQREALDAYDQFIEKQNELFVLAFEKFESALRAHIGLKYSHTTHDDSEDDKDIQGEEVEQPIEGFDYLNSLWIKITLGQFKSFGRTYFRHLRPILKTLDSLFADSDPKIVTPYEQIKALVLNI